MATQKEERSWAEVGKEANGKEMNEKEIILLKNLAGNRISVYLNINYKLYICIVPCIPLLQP